MTAPTPAEDKGLLPRLDLKAVPEGKALWYVLDDEFVWGIFPRRFRRWNEVLYDDIGQALQAAREYAALEYAKSENKNRIVIVGIAEKALDGSVLETIRYERMPRRGFLRGVQFRSIDQ